MVMAHRRDLYNVSNDNSTEICFPIVVFFSGPVVLTQEQYFDSLGERVTRGNSKSQASLMMASSVHITDAYVSSS